MDMATLSDLRWGKLGLMDVDRCVVLAILAMLRSNRLLFHG
jgi:hypothetical protein